MAVKLSTGSTKRAQPDVAEADGIAVVLEDERAFFGDTAEGGGGGGASTDGGMVLHENAVVENGKATGDDFAIGGFFRGAKDDVVGLPFAGLAGGVHERGGVAVKCAGLSVRIGFVLIRVEHLDFVAALE